MFKGQKLTFKRKSPPLSEEHKRHISEGNKGKHVGLKPSAATRNKMRLAKLGKPRAGNPENWKGHIPWNINTKGVMKPNKTSFTKGSQSGAKHHQWKGGVSKLPEYNTFLSIRRRTRKRSSGGTHTLEQWKVLKEYYGFMCLCCKKTEPEIKLSEDHIIPLKLGGTDDISNIQPLCQLCNSYKSARITDYRILYKIAKKYV